MFECEYICYCSDLGIVATPGTNISTLFEVSESDFTVKSAPLLVITRACIMGI